MRGARQRTGHTKPHLTMVGGQWRATFIDYHAAAFSPTVAFYLLRELVRLNTHGRILL